jgi:hypothetical protein
VALTLPFKVVKLFLVYLGFTTQIQAKIIPETNGYEFYIHGLVHHKSILIMVHRDATGCSLFYYTAKTTNVSGVSNTHHQEYIEL